MKLPELKGSPKQVQWAAKIRTERLKAWSEESPERFRDLEGTVTLMTDAGWWISYRDKGVDTVCNHVHQGIDLRKLQRDEWLKQEKKQEQKERAGVRAYLKKELKKEAAGKTGGVSPLPLGAASGDGGMKWEGAAVDTRTGELSRDPDLPF